MVRSSLALVLGLLVALPVVAQPTLLISNETGDSISTLNVATGVVGTFHTGIFNPDGIMVLPDGTVVATSFTDGTFNRVTGPGSFEVVAAGMNGSAGFVRSAAGFFYVANFGAPGGGGVNVSRIAPDGSIVLNFATGLSTPDDVEWNLDRTSLYVSEWGGNQIRRIDPNTGVVTPFIDGSAGLSRPSAMELDSAGNLYVTNWNNGTVSRITPSGAVTHNFATGIPNSFGLLLDEAGGWFYATSWTGGTVSRFPFAGGAAEVIATGFQGPTFLAIQPVPEPTTLALLGLAASGACAAWRRRRV